MQEIQESIKNRQVLVGGTSCTEEVGWKLLDMKKIQAVTVIHDQHFAKPRQGYVKSDPVITTIYAQV
jgi:hypothetical protein